MTAAAALRQLADSHRELSTAFLRDEEYWSPDQPPPTVVAATLARAAMQNFGKLDTTALQRIAEVIEETLRIGDTSARNTIATGFIEAVVNAVDREMPGATTLFESLGPLAREYASAWRSSA